MNAHADAPDPDAAAVAIHEMSASLRIAVARLNRRLRAEKPVEDISDSQYSVLAYLVREGPRAVGQLSDFERVTPPSMNRTVNCLVDAGYVERMSTPEDGRKVLVQTTESGRDLVTETRRRRDAWLVRRLEELAPGRREIVAEATAIIRELADS